MSLESDLIPTTEAERLLGVTRRTVEDLARSGAITGYRIGKGRGVYRFCRRSIEEYLERVALERERA